MPEKTFAPSGERGSCRPLRIRHIEDLHVPQRPGGDVQRRVALGMGGRVAVCEKSCPKMSIDINIYVIEMTCVSIRTNGMGIDILTNKSVIGAKKK